MSRCFREPWSKGVIFSVNAHSWLSHGVEQEEFLGPKSGQSWLSIHNCSNDMVQNRSIATAQMSVTASLSPL